MNKRNHANITDRKQAEKAVRESEARYQQLFDEAPVGYHEIDHEGRIVSVNKTELNMLGYTANEMIGKHICKFLKDEKLSRQAVTAKLSGCETPSSAYERIFLKSDGFEIPVLVEDRLIKDAAGKITGIRTTIQDITERKQAEEAIRESEEKYRLLVENTDTGFVIVDESGVVVEANEPYCRLVGVTKVGEIIGRSVIDWTAPESKEENAAAVERCGKEGFVQDFETTYIREDGQRVNILLNAIMHETAEGKRLHALCRDITERKHLEKINSVLFHITTATNTIHDLHELLKTTRTNLHEVIDTTNFYVGLYDGSTDIIIEPYSEDEHDKYTSFPAGKTLTAYVIKTGQSLFADESTSAELENEGKIEIFGTPSELWLGVPLRVKGITIGALVVQSYTDANLYTKKDLEILEHVSSEIAAAIERIRSEEELRKAEQKLRLHIDNTPLAVIEWDLGFKVASWNIAAQKIFGYAFEEAKGRHAAGLIVPENALALVDQAWQELLENKGGQRSVTENVTKAGDIIVCDWYNTPLVDDNDNVIGVASLVMDLTDQKKLEEQLRQAQKMEAIGQLAGGIAHDFNNLLAAIIGYSEMSLLNVDENSQAAENLNSIIIRSEKGAKLVSQLLAYSRKQTLTVIPMNLNDVLDETVQFLRHAIGEDIELTMELDPILATIEADQTALNQIITNLCVNARDAMPKGGKLGIRTQNVVLDDEYCGTHTGASPGKYVKLTVTDTGIGIDEETQKQIFDPFFTTKERYEGTGLGLSMVFGLVKQHKGHIDCTSELGKGTTFELYFPVITAQVEKETRADDQEVQEGQETILLVEDDPDVIKSSKMILEHSGYTVLTAQDGREGLKKYKDSRASIDLVIVDVILPKLGGVEMYQAIHEINPAIKFLFISGYAGTGIFEKYHLEASMELLLKPFRAKDITTKVRAVLDR